MAAFEFAPTFADDSVMRLIRDSSPATTQPRVRVHDKYPDLSDTAVLIINASEALVNAPLGGTLDDFFSALAEALLPRRLIANTNVSYFVLCFDSARPSALRITHPSRHIVRADPTDRARQQAQRTASLSPNAALSLAPFAQLRIARLADALPQAVAADCDIRTLLETPALCAAFYALLARFVVPRLSIRRSTYVVLDGLSERGPLVLHVDKDGRRAITLDTSGAALLGVSYRYCFLMTESVDRQAFWVEAFRGHCAARNTTIVVHSSHPLTCVKLLMLVETWLLGGEKPPRLYACTLQFHGHELAPSGQIHPQIQHEYVNVLIAYNSLAREFADDMRGAFAARSGNGRIHLMAALALCYGFCNGPGFVYHDEHVPRRVATLREALTRVKAHVGNNFCAGLLDVGVDCVGNTAVSLTSVHKFAQFASLLVVVARPRDNRYFRVLFPRAALFLYQLYNGHRQSSCITDELLCTTRNALPRPLSVYGYCRNKISGTPWYTDEVVEQDAIHLRE
jgi:hypothetical protein